MCQSVELSQKCRLIVAMAPPPLRLDLPTVLHFGNMEVPKRRTVAKLILDLPTVLHFGTSMLPKCCQSVELSAISPNLGEVETTIGRIETNHLETLPRIAGAESRLAGRSQGTVRMLSG